MSYRREIDGLRALAVLPVIFFHAGFETFSGGFVGVDVFFVISGYLITSLILIELDRGNFSILKFYERRARRILPALFLVMLVCIPFAWLWMLPSDFGDFSRSLVAVTLFASNFFFWRDTGYFGAEAELSPLLHTWSLAVEEQFYFLLPLCLILSWKLGKRRILALLGLVFLVSLALAIWQTDAYPEAAFFLLPSRAWELLVGVFVAFYLSRTVRSQHRRPWGELGSWLGAALILYAVFFFDETTPYPGVHAVVPTIGAALVILFASEQSTLGMFLGSRLLVGIGLLSYSAYLWHQPLFAFVRLRSLWEQSEMVYLLLSALALLMALVSWKFVERPFRARNIAY